MASHKKVSKRKGIQNSDPGKILDLVMNLNDDTCSLLQVKINVYEECDAETVFLIIVHGVGSEASIEVIGSAPLVRKHKIYMTQKLSDTLKSNMEQTELLSNFHTDFQHIVSPFLTKEGKKRIVMYPLLDKPFSILVCVVAPKHLEEEVALLVHECFLFSWPVLKKTIELEYECTLKQKCQQLLRVARRLFTQVASLDTLLQIAMEQAKQLTKAEHCSVLLIDVDRMELVERIRPSNTQAGDDSEMIERRFSMDIGITGQVIKSGTLVNCKDARMHPAFDTNVDCLPGVTCKSILCFPIREQTGIIGVGQLINKLGDPYFDVMDEEMSLAFSIYCGVCITHSVVYQKIQEAHIRNALANELVMYHMKVGDPEVYRVIECTGFHNHPHISSLHFNLRALPLRELPCYVLKMFTDLEFDKKFNIKKHKLVRFILHVKKGYRDVPYHSWLHAFSVAQWAFAAVTNYKLVAKGYYTELQALMYVIAGLVHDMDHRGTTNSFQIQGQTTLAALYSSEGSVMERHHLAQAMCVLNTEGCDILESLPRRDYDRAIMLLRDYILATDLANYFKLKVERRMILNIRFPLSRQAMCVLNTEGCDILESLPRRDYDRAIMLLRDYILATDLANYFKNLNEYKAISMDYQKGNRVHTNALQCLLMNAADLSDQLKDWGSVKKTAASVLTEFFKQGEMEKSRGELPVSIMDREKCFIPDLQIQFLNTICLPLFNIISKIIPKAQPCVKIIENHMYRWDAAKPIFSEVPITAGLSVLLSPELDNLIEKSIKDREKQKLEQAEENA